MLKQWSWPSTQCEIWNEACFKRKCLISGNKETSYLSSVMFPKIHLEGLVQACSQESTLALNTDICDPALAQGLHAQAPKTGASGRAYWQGLLSAGASGVEVSPDWLAGFWPPRLGLQRLSTHLPSRPELTPQHRPPWLLGTPSLFLALCPASTIHRCSSPSLTVVTNRGQVILSAPRQSPIYLISARLT